MKISVALCTCNGAAHLQAQLDSILQQDLPPFEIVLSDDASTDNTLAIAEAFAQRAPFFVRILRNRERLGSTRNFEQAMRACTGDLIALCDQDDVWYSQKLGTLAETLQDPAVGAAFSDGDLLQQDLPIEGSLWKSFGLTGQQLQEFSSGDPIAVMLRGNKVTGMTLILRRQLLEQVLPISPLWTHDYWLAWMLILYSRLAPCLRRLVAYRTHGQQQVGVPIRFVSAVRQRGLRTVFSELGQIARQDSARLVPQFEDLLTRLELDRSHPMVASAIPRIRHGLAFQRMRSLIQHQGLLRRIRMIAANWFTYPVFSMQPGKDRLIDLLAVRPIKS
jgi:glycosyltransferase involved in cell wall biosynthesis